VRGLVERLQVKVSENYGFVTRVLKFVESYAMNLKTCTSGVRKMINKECSTAVSRKRREGFGECTLQ
jgi:hypothetical protein